MSADQIIDGGPASSAKVQRAMQGFAGSGGGGGSGTTHTVHFTVNDEDVGTVQGDDDFAKRLANVLHGGAGSVTGR